MKRAEFLAQQEREEEIMEAFFTSPDIQRANKKDIINHIAETAVELYEAQRIRDSEVDQVFEKIMRGE